MWLHTFLEIQFCIVRCLRAPLRPLLLIHLDLSGIFFFNYDGTKDICGTGGREEEFFKWANIPKIESRCGEEPGLGWGNRGKRALGSGQGKDSMKGTTLIQEPVSHSMQWSVLETPAALSPADGLRKWGPASLQHGWELWLIQQFSHTVGAHRMFHSLLLVGRNLFFWNI